MQGEPSPSEFIVLELLRLFWEGEYQDLRDRTEVMLSEFPSSSVLHNIKGAVQKALGNNEGAARSFQRVIQLDPGYADAHNNLGVILERQGRLAAAIDSYARAPKLKPDYAEAHNNMGNALRLFGMPRAAIDSYRRALEIRPDYASAAANLLHQQRCLCDWAGIEDLESVRATLGVVGTAVSTFTMLPEEDDPRKQMLRAIVWAKEKCRRTQLPVRPAPLRRPQKLKIGCFSSEFADHPVSHSIAGLFRAHDRLNYEIYAYNYGRPQPRQLAHGSWTTRTSTPTRATFQRQNSSNWPANTT